MSGQLTVGQWGMGERRKTEKNWRKIDAVRGLVLGV